PFERRLRQNLKAGQSGSEIQSLNAVGAHIARSMEEDCIYILGPGTTTKAVMTALNLPNTLIGVDAVKNGALLGNDLNESQLLELIHRQKARIIVTVIGGQGYLFGRGNQQISHRVIRAVGRNNITVISPMAKLISLEEKRLLVDTGDAETDDMLQGHMKVIIGPKKSLTMKVSAG
ncbi:MAG: NAD(+)/NADH kinase, partial [Proteobacteria bacterium]|nr:NAD(+)/NADH kinase [Pseudomonadota bacterium]